ncbi:EAL domain-containing protein [Rhizobium sp. TRM95111]|uniref:putative bifunctional diguanylate cyclase/phosphodiesterase n=1 Tax=Rhizobium alarense TaxID=2846851 RepID=UPI001F1AE676|nr:EAL domain-containing protein [Rhizobium alarense]MCF3638535.1 EAL domain-containing protein [Rhizobium alarense]
MSINRLPLANDDDLDPALRLISAGERLMKEAHRLFPVAFDQTNRNVWLEAMIDEVPDYLYFKDRNGCFVVANRAISIDSLPNGYESLEGLSDFDIHPEHVARGFFETEQEIMRNGNPMLDMEEFIRDARGTPKWMLSSKLPIRDHTGEVVGLVGIARDITERKKAESLHVGQAHLLKMIALGAPLVDVFSSLILLIEGQVHGVIGSILMLGGDGRTIRHGAAPNLDPLYCKAIDGIEIGPKVGSCGTAMWRGEPVIVTDILTDPLWESFTELVKPYGFRSCWSAPIHSYQGKVLGSFALYSCTPGKPSPECQKLVGMATHIAGIAIERKEAEDRIQFMAHHDTLTGLPNRGMLAERVASAIENADDGAGGVTLAFLDLDNFKLVNDSLGHNAGDELLKAVTERMLRCVRASDTIIRLGGDEFVVLLGGRLRRGETVEARLETLRQAIAEPVMLAGRSIQVTCSMGVATYPEHGRNATELLANADAAMYHAKEKGRDALQFFSAEMATHAKEKLLQQEELREAILRKQFLLHFQPQMDLATGRIFAVETLIRWRHPERGMVSPGSFIPLAEETGLIGPIGDWTLNAACRQNKAWQDAGLPPIVVSVNVSARQFQQKDWVERVARALKDSGLEARYLELELTESLIMQDVQQAVETMHRLEALGVHLAIDDFGTGYSSLSSLKRFPVGRLKIDQSFVQDLPADQDDAAIARAIVSLAHTLQLKVIAEGVETREQVDFLREAGCDEIQGYYLSRPIEARAVEALLRIPNI